MLKMCNLSVNGINYSDYYLIHNISEYNEYLTILNNKFLISEKEIINIESFIGHGHSLLTGITGIFSGMIPDKDERDPMILHLKYLHAKVLMHQVKDILAGCKIAINKKGGYFKINPKQEYTILKDDKNDKNIELSEKDIKVMKYFGGNHYYAKVNDIDVVDSYGNVKWNTEKQAYEVALIFIKTIK